jgi:hypothetical protein
VEVLTFISMTLRKDEDATKPSKRDIDKAHAGGKNTTHMDEAANNDTRRHITQFCNPDALSIGRGFDAHINAYSCNAILREL